MDGAACVLETDDGGYLLAGHTDSHLSGESLVSDAWLVKTESEGNEEWKQTFGGKGDDAA